MCLSAFATEFQPPFEPVPEGEHGCPAGTVPAKYRGGSFYSYVCQEGGRAYAWEGPFRRFGLDGTLWVSGEYRDGRRHGNWSIFNTDGTLSWSADFPLGFGKFLRCPDGSHPRPGITGNATRNQYLCLENRRVVGPVMVLHPWTLRPKFFCIVVNGRIHGPALQWNDSGELDEILIYEEGRIVSRRVVR